MVPLLKSIPGRRPPGNTRLMTPGTITDLIGLALGTALWGYVRVLRGRSVTAT